MVCMNRVASTYERKEVQVKVEGVSRVIPVGIALDLLYSMVLGREWSEVYDIVEKIRQKEKHGVGLIGEESLPDNGEEDKAVLDFEKLASQACFRETQRQDLFFQGHMGNRNFQTTGESDLPGTL